MKRWLCCMVAFAVAQHAYSATRPATERELGLIRAGLEDRLKDSESARFRNVRLATDGELRNTFCGEVNSKNGYGAYVGFTSFMGMLIPAATKDDKPTAFILRVDEDDSPVAASVCADNGI